MQQIDISSLSLEQVSLLKSQFEQEIEQLSSLRETLLSGISRFENTRAALQSLAAGSEDSELLVPLTGSLYAPGRLKDVDNVLVDVGTGYFIERTRHEAQDFVSRKLEQLYTKEEEARVALLRKKESHQSIIELMQHHVAQLQQKSAQA